VTRLFYLPLVVLTMAYVILCVHHGTAWPWNVVVHEDGRRTLLETIFYFDHALGELPLDLLLSAAVAGAMLCAYSPKVGPVGRLTAVCLALDAAIVAGACILSGVKVATLYLFQFHTRDDEPMLYGSHWRYHLLSQAALMLLPLAFFKLKRNPVLVAAWAALAALTIVFGISSASFIDPRYLGHQARELITHTLVTIPLAVAGLLTWRTHSCVPRSHSCERLLSSSAGINFNWKPALAFLAISTYLATGVLLTGARHHAQSSDWTAVICAHFFEHTFSYLVVPAHAKLFYLLGARHA
jgi:hypothetical protein